MSDRPELAAWKDFKKSWTDEQYIWFSKAVTLMLKVIATTDNHTDNHLVNTREGKFEVYAEVLETNE